MKYVIEYDEDDLIWVATCPQWPLMAAHAHTPQGALEELLFAINHARAKLAAERNRGRQ